MTQRAGAATNAVTRPPRADVLLMAIGVLAVSTSGPLMAGIVAAERAQHHRGNNQDPSCLQTRPVPMSAYCP